MTKSTTLCWSCGIEVQGDKSECENCGAPVDDDATVVTERENASEAISPDDRLAAQLRRALSPKIQLLRRLAGGGMSVVYLARDPALRRLVAIKVLADDLARDPVARQRFTREAEAAAAIVDPHIIEIYQVDSLPRTKRPFFIMQFVDGLTLQQEILSGKPAPEALAKAVIGEVASALAAAHARGVVHRDIKPANIVLDRETSRAVVLDFGISAVLKNRAGPDTEKLTLQGVSVGTPAYMSPEQAAARDVTDRSDVYSLGVVAFEFVTGQLPFKAEAPEGYIAAHLQDTPPDVRSLRPDLDKQFADLINRCLSKKPDDRPAAEEIARAYIPSARLSVEWPPPGLDALRGMGWRQLRTLVATAIIGMVFFALLLLPPGSHALTQFATGGAEFAAGDAEGTTDTVWLFLLGAAILATVPLTAIARVRGWKLVALLKWARGLGYPWPVLLDVALDGPDTAALVNGYGVFALASVAKRRRLLSLKRYRAGAIVASATLATLGPLLWAVGFANRPPSENGALISPSDGLVIFLPAAAALVLAALFALPEWLVRNRAGRWGPFGPLGWSLPPMRPELVEEWLRGVDREAVPAGSKFVRWVSAITPVTVGGTLSLLMFAILTLTLSVVVTSSQWIAASREVANGIMHPPEGALPQRDAFDLVAASARVAAPPTRSNRNVDILIRESQQDVASALPRDEVDPHVHESLWRDLPDFLSDGARADLAQDTLWPALATWRAIGYAPTAMPFWTHGDSLSGIDDPLASVRLFPYDDAVKLAHKNESAALLAMAANDPVTALRRARENIAVGLKLLRDPLNGWVARDVIEVGRRIIGEVGLLTANRNLLLEAASLEDALGPADTRGWQSVTFSSALMAEPVNPPGLDVVADRDRFAFERWWAIGGVVPGFCGNSREIFFGVDSRRGDALARAAEMADDIPRTAEWVAVNARWLQNWIENAKDLGTAPLPRFLIPLRWVGLKSLARRIAFCQEAADGFGGG